MSIVPYQNGNFDLKDGEVLFHEGEKIQSVNILMQGSADVYISGLDSSDGFDDEQKAVSEGFKIFSAAQNTFLGVHGFFNNQVYDFSYKASGDSKTYVFLIQSKKQLYALLKQKKDYATFIMASSAITMEKMQSMYGALKKLEYKFEKISDNLGAFYWAQQKKLDTKRKPSVGFLKDAKEYFQKLEKSDTSIPQNSFEKNFFEEDHSDITGAFYSDEIDIETKKIDYYKRLSKLPPKLRKPFFAADLNLTVYLMEESSKIIEELGSGIKDTINSLKEYAQRLFSEENENLFFEIAQTAFESAKSRGAVDELLIDAAQYICDSVKALKKHLQQTYDYDYKIDVEYMDTMIQQLKMKNQEQSATAEDGGDAPVSAEGGSTLPDELKNSAKRILEFADIPKDRYDLFWKNLEIFRNMESKYASDNDSRKVRKALASVFFEIYELLYKKMRKQGKDSRLFEMFLNYGFMDEMLLDNMHILTLYKLNDKSDSLPEIDVYNSHEWLDKIYDMEKLPSVNGFGQDYEEVFREMIKRGEATKDQKEEYMQDVDRRLGHEVDSMMKTNQRLCFGQLSVYSPILHDEMVMKELSQAMVTKETVGKAVKEVLDVDFSAFHREVLFRDMEKNIDKEFVMMKVIPDIILLPTYGSRAFMWQELSGRSRLSKGRIILPIFTNEDLNDFIIQSVGAFRWELCKTILGPSWQDVTRSSLTADYSDYIQFYKKNRDLSSEAKEKIKTQLSKNRNNTRDVFVDDYFNWIKYESKGIMRLNKVVRSILFRHCPFSLDIRKEIANQPMFSDIANKFKNIRRKKIKEVENRYHKYTKNGGELAAELQANLDFYKEQ